MFSGSRGSSWSYDEVTRRDVVRAGSLAALGFVRPCSSPATIIRSEPDISCILLWLQGGLSHLDSFDPKPEAPSDIRGEFGVIDTNVAGIKVCDPLPRLARIQDKYSILRSLNPRNGTHGVAEAYMLSGHMFNPRLAHPSFGAVISKAKGERAGLPAYVQLGGDLDPHYGGGGAGYLGDSHRPWVLAKDLSVHDSVPRLTSPRTGRALEVGRADERIRESYGRHALGQRCLLARRLIEAGVRFVTVTDGGWDTHTNNFQDLRDRCLPRLDGALSTLLQDLSDRGLLDTTLVVALSDFGRNPRVNDTAGRDHWANAGVALLAGGGIKGGVVVGQTDTSGEEAIDSPYHAEDLAVTLYHRLGVSRDALGQPPKGRLIRELL